jgi:nucleoid-associated protein YgaU
MSELERYGVAAFAVTLILVLLISLGGLTSRGDAQLAKIPMPVADAGATRAHPDDPLVVARGDAPLSEPTSSLQYADEVMVETDAPSTSPVSGRTSTPVVSATVLGGGNGAAQPHGAATTSATSYRVQRGDTLERIAERMLGDGKRWTDIARLNGLGEATHLAIGQDLRLPGKQAATPAAPPAAPAASKKLAKAPTTVRIYTVEKGDTLESIAEKQLGDKRRWREIYDFNRSRLKKPDSVDAGVKLQMPQK